MQIRRNTKAFKSILEIITACHSRADRRELVRLYITKAGNSIIDRIPVEAIQGDTEFFYDLNYQSVLNNLNASSHQLHQSDDTPGIYFFHSLNKEWDETPFEFDTKVKELFPSLPESPVVRERSSVKEFVSPTQSTPKPEKKQKSPPVVKQPVMVVHRGPKQPDYKLRHHIEFTDLEKVIFRKEGINKKDLLDHYNKISEYLLPYLKHRKKLHDREGLLSAVEDGTIQFDTSNNLDQMIIVVDSGSGFEKAIEAANVLHDILNGLKLPAFVKTDALSALNVHVPLDAKSDTDTIFSAAEYICKLVWLKRPDLIAVEGSGENSYGKVTLDPALNKEDANVIAPYSFASSGPATIATPLEWEEVIEGLQVEDFNYKTIFERLKKHGDPFEHMMKKKINAEELLSRLEEHYSFLL